MAEESEVFEATQLQTCNIITLGFAFGSYRLIVLIAFFVVVMSILSTLFQIIIALGIFNVWLLRSSRATPYRGKDMPSLKSEFAAYGLPESVFYAVGVLKLSAAVALLLGIFIPALVLPGAVVIGILMLGAVLMHLKVRDPINKFLPATIMLLMACFLIF